MLGYDLSPRPTGRGLLGGCEFASAMRMQDSVMTWGHHIGSDGSSLGLQQQWDLYLYPNSIYPAPGDLRCRF